MTFNLERFQELVDTQKQMVKELYEELGAGSTFTPTALDKPKRVYLLT